MGPPADKSADRSLCGPEGKGTPAVSPGTCALCLWRAARLPVSSGLVVVLSHATVTQRPPYPPGAGGPDLLVDGQGLAQRCSALVGLAVLEVASAGAFLGASSSSGEAISVAIAWACS